jgi:hypothetical protein
MYFIVRLIINIQNGIMAEYFFALQLQNVIKIARNEEVYHIINNC